MRAPGASKLPVTGQHPKPVAELWGSLIRSNLVKSIGSGFLATFHRQEQAGLEGKAENEQGLESLRASVAGDVLRSQR